MLTLADLNMTARGVLGRDAATQADVDAWNAVGGTVADYYNALTATPEFSDRYHEARRSMSPDDPRLNPMGFDPAAARAANPTTFNTPVSQLPGYTGPTGGLSGPAAQPQPTAPSPTTPAPTAPISSDQQANGYGLPNNTMPYYGPMQPGAIDYGFGMYGMYGMMPPWGMWGFGGGLNNMWGQAQPQSTGAPTGAPFNAGIGTSNPTQFNYQAGDRTQEYAGAPSSNPMDTGRGFGFQFRRGGYARRYRRGGLARLAA